jgi:hypothetical protein
MDHRGDLLLRLSYSTGKHGAPEGMRAAIEHHACRRKMIRKTIVHPVAGTKPSSEQCACYPPKIVAAVSLPFDS